jgi:23S rRNA (uracil1939-C5)-methyltransferase
VLRPELQAALGELRAHVLAGDARAAAGEYRAVAGDDGVALLTPDGAARREELTVTVAGERLRFDVECFFQANHGILPALVAEVIRRADAAPALPHHVGGGRYEQRRVALDLYAGVGLFTLPLARRFDRVFAVDSHRRAAGFARKNAAAAGLANIRVAAVPVARWLAERGRAVGAVSCVVVDPPRTGIDPEALAGLRHLQPPTIVCVSCDPATFARDTRSLLADGYRLTSIVGFDMFPQTHHVEIVGSLTRPA